MVRAGRDVIEKQPQPDEMVAMLVPLLEAFLAEPATTEVHDRIRQGVVLYMGALAKHIPPEDPKVGQVCYPPAARRAPADLRIPRV